MDLPRLLNRNSFAVKVSPVLFCVWQVKDTETQSLSEFHMQKAPSHCPAVFVRSVIKRRKSDYLETINSPSIGVGLGFQSGGESLLLPCIDKLTDSVRLYNVSLCAQEHTNKHPRESHSGAETTMLVYYKYDTIYSGLL